MGGAGICLGPVFALDGQRWRVRMQCPISLTSASPYVSLLLATAGGNVGHSRCRLKIVNHLDSEQDVVVHASRDFSDPAAAGTARSAMGDRAVIELSTLRDVCKGFLQDELLQVEVQLWQQNVGTAAGGTEASATAVAPPDRAARKLNDSTTAAAKGRIRRRTRSRTVASTALAEVAGDIVGMSLDDADNARRRRRRRARRLGPTNRTSTATSSLQAVVGALDGDTNLCSLFAGARIGGSSTV
jgi:hypothetical protein